MRPSSTARRYAQAAFEVAQNDGDVPAWLRDLRSIAEALRDEDLSRYFKDPAVDDGEKLATIEKAFGDVRPHLMNLLKILVSRRRMYLITQIAREFEDLHREAAGILEARVTVARPLDEAEQAAIARQLSEGTGKKVEVRTEVDNSILGGIIVRIGDRLVDASVAGRLQRLHQEIAV